MPISFLSDEELNKPIQWLIFECSSPEKQWLCAANEIIMEFGGVFHSIFLRWAVTINGLHVAAEKYQSKEWLNSGKAFAVSGIRNSLSERAHELTHVQVWDGKMAGEVHASSVPMLAAWAFCNMYSCLEEFVFNMFKTFLNAHPLVICKGDDFRTLRQSYRNREIDARHTAEWENLWSERLEKWHRKRLYDGLEKVFTNFVNQSGLKVPSSYEERFSYTDIAKTLGGISLIRNCFIHGATEVPKELGDFCKTFQASLFSFKTGDRFEITLHELATLEHFTHSLTQTLNNSFMELAYPELKKMGKQLYANEFEVDG